MSLNNDPYKFQSTNLRSTVRRRLLSRPRSSKLYRKTSNGMAGGVQ